MIRVFTGPTKIGKELAKIKERLKGGRSRSQNAIEDPRYRKAISGPERGIHGPMHALAKEISEYAGEPKKFAMYLGIIKNIGLRGAYRLFSEIKQSKNVKTPGKLFVYESAYKRMEIVKVPNKILREKLKNVDEITSKLKKVILNMKKVMKKNQGIGLAANQVGLDLAVFVVDEELAKENNAPSVYINPEIKPYPRAGRAGSKNDDELEEGCLSIPETWLKIKRAKKVKVKALDENGKKFKFIAKGFLARVLQHEYDHLNGKMIIDKNNMGNV